MAPSLPSTSLSVYVHVCACTCVCVRACACVCTCVCVHVCACALHYSIHGWSPLVGVGRTKHWLSQDVKRQDFRTRELALSRVTLQITNSRKPEMEQDVKKKTVMCRTGTHVCMHTRPHTHTQCCKLVQKYSSYSTLHVQWTPSNPATLGTNQSYKAYFLDISKQPEYRGATFQGPRLEGVYRTSWGKQPFIWERLV